MIPCPPTTVRMLKHTSLIPYSPVSIEEAIVTESFEFLMISQRRAVVAPIP